MADICKKIVSSFKAIDANLQNQSKVLAKIVLASETQDYVSEQIFFYGIGEPAS